MPTLKHLTCHVEWSSSNIPLEEYNTTYTDGYVSTYIAIPSTPTPFSIHLTSHGYIAPGLAMFVYMDGVYQVNRNRRNLKIPGEGTKRSHTEVDFRVRQKEELLWDGSFEGKEWRFEKANIVDSPSGESKQCAPHDGEYVGTIEVVVLRCLPATDDVAKSTSTSSKTARYRQIKNGSSTSSEEPSDTDYSRFPGVYDGPGDSYPVLTRKSQAKPKHKFNSKNQYSAKALGLDGAWDGDNEAKSTTGDEFDWDKPIPPQEGQKSETKGSWGGPSSPIAEVKGKALANWDNSPLPKEKAKTDTWGAWCVKPASPPAGERKDKGAWGAWDVPDVPKEPTKGRIEMTSATTGVWHPSGQIATSIQESGNSSTTSNSGGGSTTRTEAPRIRGRHSRTSSNHQHGPAMRLRGGAPGSYNVSTPGSGHQTPTVIVNINNGPPPPRDWMAEAKKEREQSANGPPPPRDWMAEAKKEKKSPPPASPTDALWTTDLPPYDPSQDPAVNENGNENGNGNWQHNGNGQQMPGAWDDSGNDGWGTANGDWNASGNDNDKANNDNLWGNAGDDPFQDAPKDNAKTKNDSWGNNNDTEQTDDWNTKGDNQDTSWGADNDKDNAQQATGWDANADNKDQQNDSWGNEDNKANDFSWGADKTEPEAKAGSTDPVTRKTSDSKAASQFTFGNSKPKRSKAGSVKSKVSANSKINDWSFNALNSPKKSKKGTPKSTPLPGAWSPPPASPPPSPKSKKNKRSKSSSSPRSSPTLNSPTPQPHPKPYWSTWRIPYSPFTDSPAKHEPPAPPPPCEDSLYPVPRAVARRHGTSHQVQPGKAAPYMHKKNKPQYMDDMESPYAVFEFRYRDKETLERLLSHALPPEPPAHEKLRLLSLTKNELIDEFLKTKTKLSSTSSQATYKPNNPTPKPASTTSKSNKSNSRKASASTASIKAATLHSNPKGIEEVPDISALDERLKKLETSKTEEEGVKGWLEGTNDDAGDWGGNGNNGSTKKSANGGSGGGDSGNANPGGTRSAGSGKTKKTNSGGKANAKANNKKGKENNSGGDFNAWGTGSAWDAKDEKKDSNGGGNGNGNGNDWNDTSGGNGNDWNNNSGFGDTGGGGGGAAW